MLLYPFIFSISVLVLYGMHVVQSGPQIPTPFLSSILLKF